MPGSSPMSPATPRAYSRTVSWAGHSAQGYRSPYALTTANSAGPGRSTWFTTTHACTGTPAALSAATADPKESVPPVHGAFGGGSTLPVPRSLGSGEEAAARSGTHTRGPGLGAGAGRGAW